jgi:DNA-binding MarR family transcriptional regulator
MDVDESLAESAVARPAEILFRLLELDDIDRDGFRMSLWSSFYTGPVFAEIERRFGLARDENNVLFSLAYCSPLTAKSISDFLGRPKNSISRAVDLLLKKNLIEAETDVTDRRRILLTIRPEGRALHEQTLEVSKAHERLMLKALDADERKALDAILAKLMRSAEDWIGPF